MSTYLAIIPARGGSKSLPLKNIVDLAGKPLIAWTIEAALGAKQLSKVVVSSDDRAILDTAVEFGAESLQRPAELARDSSPTAPLVRHAVEYFVERGLSFDFTVLLQPTSPLRSAEDIDAAIDLIRSRQADALISVYEPVHTPFKAFVENADGYLSGLVDNETPFKRRQDLPRALMPNGAIYIVETEFFMRTGRFFGPRTVAFEMPADSSVDIDSEEDLEAAKCYLRRHGRVPGVI